jgi:hypothetical protein
VGKTGELPRRHDGRFWHIPDGCLHFCFEERVARSDAVIQLSG